MIAAAIANFSTYEKEDKTAWHPSEFFPSLASKAVAEKPRQTQSTEEQIYAMELVTLSFKARMEQAKQA